MQTRCYVLQAVPTLFSATTNGVFLDFNKFIDSMVCGSKPCMMSTTKMAISQSDEPRVRRLLYGWRTQRHDYVSP